MGVGERAGVVDSYKKAFEKLPTTEEEWRDLIKIANGRWPTERSQKAEVAAIEQFKIIYLREPDFENEFDKAVIAVIAYGLRPSESKEVANVNFDIIYGYDDFTEADKASAEEKAKKEFEKIFNRVPDMTNPKDEREVMIIAYGVNPTGRNLNKEKAAIGIFRSIHGRLPVSAVDWDVVRAIAYSGATK